MNQKNPKKTKEEREQEFVDGVERILGFPLLPYQRQLILSIRADSLAGRTINVDELTRRIHARPYR